jgi:hypothetical protein
MAKAIVEAVNNYDNPIKLAEISKGPIPLYFFFREVGKPYGKGNITGCGIAAEICKRKY